MDNAFEGGDAGAGASAPSVPNGAIRTAGGEGDGSEGLEKRRVESCDGWGGVDRESKRARTGQDPVAIPTDGEGVRKVLEVQGVEDA